jgi:hypothetical protein
LRKEDSLANQAAGESSFLDALREANSPRILG